MKFPTEWKNKFMFQTTDQKTSINRTLQGVMYQRTLVFYVLDFFCTKNLSGIQHIVFFGYRPKWQFNRSWGFATLATFATKNCGSHTPQK